MRNRPHFGHLAEASFFCPGNRNLPNMAMTPMKTRNSMTILTITSEAKPGVVSPFLNRCQSILRNAGAEFLQQPALASIFGKTYVVAVKLFQLGHDMANAIDQAQLIRPTAQPEFSGEKILIVRKFGTTARFDVIGEPAVHLFQNGFQARNVLFLFRQERVHETLGMDRGMHPALHPLAGKENRRAKAG